MRSKRGPPNEKRSSWHQTINGLLKESKAKNLREVAALCDRGRLVVRHRRFSKCLIKHKRSRANHMHKKQEAHIIAFETFLTKKKQE
ncbi:unnamed protein product [Dovyalis caffra]|uniref:Uncharacterized protein n=1 Tax=Dovyalis caffra TaxID=77055 RepID=A0AAV1SUF0_9ROSI|nr:unnamed protein product [Dovyalis caffra]